MSPRAVFLDRDGTILEHYDYLTDESQVQLPAGVATALRRLKDRGYLLIVVTNQSAIARGMLTEQKLTDIHARLKSLLAEQAVYLDAIHYCPYHPEAAIPKYRRQSDLRKPAPGMLLAAAEEMDIDLSQSWMVGDDDRDIEAGRAAGCRTILLESRGSSQVQRGADQADYLAVNLPEAANLIIRHGAQAATTENPPAIPITAPEPAQLTPAAPEIIPEPEPMPPNPDPNPVPTITAVADDPRPPRSTTNPSKAPTGRSLMAEILREVRSMSRQQRFAEFSVFKLLAGVVQMLVIGCLIMAYRYAAGPEAQEAAVRNCLLLALTFQTMTLTLVMLHRSH